MVRKMKPVYEIVADMLSENGLDHIFALPGGVTPKLIEECHMRNHEFTTIIARHEGAAAVMCDMYARMTGKPGVLIGQGLWMATNGGFGIAEAFLAGVPMVIISEFSDWDGVNHQAPYQCGTGEYGTVNLPNVYRAFTKYTGIANNPGELLYALQLAIKHAVSGRPGPAAVLCKWKVMITALEHLRDVEPPLYPLAGLLKVNPPCISKADTIKIANMLENAKNPVMICGRGVQAAKAHAEVREIAEMLGMPVACSYMGKSSLEETHDLALGHMGALGQKLANRKIREADVIFVVGSALAPDNTKGCSAEFIDAISQKIIQIDIDPHRAGWTYPIALGVTSEAKFALTEIISELKNRNLKIDATARVNDLLKLKEDPENEWFYSDAYEKEDVPLYPEKVVNILNRIIREEDLMIVGGGNARMWVTKLFKTKRAGQFYGAGGAAGMAWTSSAVATAALLHKNGRVFGVIGDGSMLMALYNLSTLRQYNLPATIIVFNNNCYGNVRDFMTSKGRDFCDYHEENFSDIAKALGVQGYRTTTEEEFEKAVQESFDFDGPVVIDMLVKPAPHSRIKN
jgi:acetolactate synthase-1/2/3 large subunit